MMQGTPGVQEGATMTLIGSLTTLEPATDVTHDRFRAPQAHCTCVERIPTVALVSMMERTAGVQVISPGET